MAESARVEELWRSQNHPRQRRWRRKGIGLRTRVSWADFPAPAKVGRACVQLAVDALRATRVIKGRRTIDIAPVAIVSTLCCTPLSVATSLAANCLPRCLRKPQLLLQGPRPSILSPHLDLHTPPLSLAKA